MYEGASLRHDQGGFFFRFFPQYRFHKKTKQIFLFIHFQGSCTCHICRNPRTYMPTYAKNPKWRCDPRGRGAPVSLMLPAQRYSSSVSTLKYSILSLSLVLYDPMNPLSRVCLQRGLGAQAQRRCSTVTYQYAGNWKSSCLRVVCLICVAKGHAMAFFGMLVVVETTGGWWMCVRERVY